MNPQQSENAPHIIGWGLAGATLAWQLHFRNQKFVVHDSGKNYSTRVAAGLVNPIVFKRLTKSWNADLLMPYSVEFYQKIAAILDVKLVSKKIFFTRLQIPKMKMIGPPKWVMTDLKTTLNTLL
jgi:hypothetical protein